MEIHLRYLTESVELNSYLTYIYERTPFTKTQFFKFIMFNFYGFYLGPGQSIEQAIAQPVIRMQPVMQQTNVIHVGQGGTVIFPTGQQVNQVRPTQNAMSNQATSFSSRKFQFSQKNV